MSVRYSAIKMTAFIIIIVITMTIIIVITMTIFVRWWVAGTRHESQLSVGSIHHYY